VGDVKTLNQDMEKNKLKSFYVFTGEEGGLIQQYITDIKGRFKTVVELDEKNGIDQIIEDNKYNSIWGGGKLYILRETGLFNKVADDKFINFLVMMFKQTKNVCIFVESELNKTMRQTQSLGETQIIEFKKLNEDQLIAFVKSILDKNGKRMLKDLTRYFVDQCDYDYNTIVNEVTKLLNYVDGKEIKVDDVKAVVSRSTKSIVFDLVEHIVRQRYQKAFYAYELLLSKKEQPLVILTLVYRQFKLLYQIKLLKAEGYNDNDIAEACDSKPFIIQKSAGLCDFDTEKLLSLLIKCGDMDFKIKTGKIKDVLAINCIILYSSIRKQV
jgi:DNA polymerase-3 subunit delta